MREVLKLSNVTLAICCSALMIVMEVIPKSNSKSMKAVNDALRCAVHVEQSRQTTFGNVLLDFVEMHFAVVIRIVHFEIDGGSQTSDNTNRCFKDSQIDASRGSCADAAFQSKLWSS